MAHSGQKHEIRRWDFESRGQPKRRMPMNTWPSCNAMWEYRICPGDHGKPAEWSDWLVTLQSVPDFVIILILVSCCGYVVFLSYFCSTLLFLFFSSQKLLNLNHNSHDVVVFYSYLLYITIFYCSDFSNCNDLLTKNDINSQVLPCTPHFPFYLTFPCL